MSKILEIEVERREGGVVIIALKLPSLIYFPELGLLERKNFATQLSVRYWRWRWGVEYFESSSTIMITLGEKHTKEQEEIASRELDSWVRRIDTREKGALSKLGLKLLQGAAV